MEPITKFLTLGQIRGIVNEGGLARLPRQDLVEIIGWLNKLTLDVHCMKQMVHAQLTICSDATGGYPYPPFPDDGEL